MSPLMSLLLLLLFTLPPSRSIPPPPTTLSLPLPVEPVSWDINLEYGGAIVSCSLSALSVQSYAWARSWVD